MLLDSDEVVKWKNGERFLSDVAELRQEASSALLSRYVTAL